MVLGTYILLRLLKENTFRLQLLLRPYALEKIRIYYNNLTKHLHQIFLKILVALTPYENTTKMYKQKHKTNKK